ncbi:MAG: ornithine carbamoyltransferase, partial [Alphaproteobacteria bacterium]|nr:ornithine carbamoyltransferase [Alphaproteobacteria bacterium]
RTKHHLCEGLTMSMIFAKPSARTRISFETGMVQLGGYALYLSPNDIGIGKRESVKDIARVISRYNDIIMARLFDHEHILELAKYASVPVINGLTDYNHPCQIMADILCYEHHRGSIEGKVITWCGDGNNVAISWIHAAAKFGFEMRLACPKELLPDQKTIDTARAEGAKIIIEQDIVKMVEGSDCVVTDTWVSMGDEASNRLEILKPYQVTAKLMGKAKSDAVFMHCLPAHRGEEMTSEVIDGLQSIVFDEAECRLHVQKAILNWCLS